MWLLVQVFLQVIYKIFTEAVFRDLNTWHRPTTIKFPLQSISKWRRFIRLLSPRGFILIANIWSEMENPVGCGWRQPTTAAKSWHINGKHNIWNTAVRQSKAARSVFIPMPTSSGRRGKMSSMHFVDWSTDIGEKPHGAYLRRGWLCMHSLADRSSRGRFKP